MSKKTKPQVRDVTSKIIGDKQLELLSQMAIFLYFYNHRYKVAYNKYCGYECLKMVTQVTHHLL